MYNSYSPFLSLFLTCWVPVAAAVSALFLDFSYRGYFSAPSSFLFDREEPENSVGELREQTYQEEEDVNVNKPCVTAREGIYFFP